MENTDKQYAGILEKCREIFFKKMEDYGPSWRILRNSSLTDQLFIKAKRIRSIQEKNANKVGEAIDGEFLALVNYSIMALIQLELGPSEEPDLKRDEAEKLYAKYAGSIQELFDDKNHDYGEAWRDLRISSMTDLILVKLFRIRQIEENDGKTSISEGVDSNLMDIANYAIFCLILLSENN